MRSFRWCAMHYLTQWWKMDRDFIEEFRRGAIRPALVQGLCKRYGVDRNFSGSGEAKYEQFCTFLIAERDRQLSRDNVVAFIQEQLANMKKEYGGGVLSATTKAFWMSKGHPVVIYDRFSRQGLRAESKTKVSDRDYKEYVEAWFAFLIRPSTAEGIRDAHEWLFESEFISALAKEWNVDGDETKGFIRSEDFRNRVADMYLFHVGKERR